MILGDVKQCLLVSNISFGFWCLTFQCPWVWSSSACCCFCCCCNIQIYSSKYRGVWAPGKWPQHPQWRQSDIPWPHGLEQEQGETNENVRIGRGRVPRKKNFSFFFCYFCFFPQLSFPRVRRVEYKYIMLWVKVPRKTAAAIFPARPKRWFMVRPMRCFGAWLR